jgi:hypothetical protein
VTQQSGSAYSPGHGSSTPHAARRRVESARPCCRTSATTTDSRGSKSLRPAARRRTDWGIFLGDVPAATTQSSREDVRTRHPIFVGEPGGDWRKVRTSIGNEEIRGPRAVDGVAETPAADRSAALRVHTVEAMETLAARRDRPHNHALPDRVLVFQARAKLVDHTHRLVTKDENPA